MAAVVACTSRHKNITYMIVALLLLFVLSIFIIESNNNIISNSLAYFSSSSSSPASVTTIEKTNHQEQEDSKNMEQDKDHDNDDQRQNKECDESSILDREEQTTSIMTSTGTGNTIITDKELVDSTWCPFANKNETNLCQFSPLCPRPCHERYLFVMATGRSGSTTMMQMLNMLPGVRMTGENNDALSRTFNLVLSSEGGIFQDPMVYKTRKNLDYAWGHYPIQQSDMTCVVQNVINSLNPPPPKEQMDMLNNSVVIDDSHVIKGFKTIRLHGHSDESAEDVVLKVRQTLPCSRIVINLKSNIEAQTKSQILKHMDSGMEQDALHKALQNANNKLLQIATILGNQQAFVFDSNIYNNSTDAALAKYNHLAKWLGFVNCTYHNLAHAHAKHSFQTRQYKKPFDLGPTCHYEGDWPAGAYKNLN